MALRPKPCSLRLCPTFTQTLAAGGYSVHNAPATRALGRPARVALLWRQPVFPHTLESKTMRDLYITWDDYNRLIEQLTLQIHASGYQFDSLLCLARGGLRIGDVISRIYDMPLALLATSSYREAAGTRQGQLDIAEYITMTDGRLHGKLLLVDDLVDSGTTLTRVLEYVQQRCSAVTEIRTAVLWYKAVSKYKPDYYVQYLPTSPWIHQPFEAYDTLRPCQLAARLHSEKG